MRILDEAGQELRREEIDINAGHLVPEKVLAARHEAVEAVEEVGHWETVAEYPNGGKDVAWVVEVPGVEPMEAWDEYEDVLRYVAYTPEELEARADALAAERYRAARLEALLESAVLREELAETVTELLHQLLPKLWNGTEGSV